MTHFKYLWSLIRHKFWVFVGGMKLWRAGIYLSPLRLIVHDYSKFGPGEWNAYRRRFWDRTWRTPGDRAEFDRAWNHHQKANDHHWNYWVIIRANGDPECLEMSEPAVREMVADWYGAGRAYNGRNEVVEWYEGQRDQGHIKLHPRTRARVEELLGKVGTREVVPMHLYFKLRRDTQKAMLN